MPKMSTNAVAYGCIFCRTGNEEVLIEEQVALFTACFAIPKDNGSSAERVKPLHGLCSNKTV